MKNRRIILTAPPLLALALFGLGACKAKPEVKAAAKKQETVEVRVVQAVSRNINRAVDSVGTLYPFDETVVSAEIDGRIEEVKVDLGDQVQAGQVMVRISDEEQRLIVSQSEAQLRSSLERLGLKDEKDKLDDPKNAPDPRRAAAELQEAEQRYKRQQQLNVQQIGTQAELDQAGARFRAAQGRRSRWR